MKNLESTDRNTIKQNQLLKSIELKSEEIVQIKFCIKMCNQKIKHSQEALYNFNLIFYDKGRFEQDVIRHTNTRNRFVRYLNFKAKQLSELCNQLKEVCYDSE